MKLIKKKQHILGYKTESQPFFCTWSNWLYKQWCGGKDTLKAVSSEGQGPVAAGLALCAASAGPRICGLLHCWSHTVDIQTQD